MINVYFHGDLKKFGSVFSLNVNTAAEALKALMVQLKGLRFTLQQGQYYVKLNNETMTEKTIDEAFKQDLNTLKSPFKNQELHITPAIFGAGRFGQIIVGAVLIVAGAVAMAYGQPWGMNLIIAGAGMVIGGVVGLLTKPPSMDMEKNPIQQSKSSAFGNLGNSIADGSCVPIVYGQVKIGSKVISQSLESYDTKKDEQTKPKKEKHGLFRRRD